MHLSHAVAVAVVVVSVSTITANLLFLRLLMKLLFVSLFLLFAELLRLLLV